MEDRPVKKRRRHVDDRSDGHKLKKKRSEPSGIAQDLNRKIEDLEAQILDSQKNYNKLNELLEYAKESDPSGVQIRARVALCAIFSHFLVDGKFQLDGSPTTQEDVVGRWLVKKYEQFSEILMKALFEDSDLSLKLLMQLVQQEVSSASSNHIWTDGLYLKIIDTLLEDHKDGPSFEDFAEEHILPYKDARMFACRIISGRTDLSSLAMDQITSFLTAIPPPRKDDEETNSCLATIPPHLKRKAPSDAAYKKAVEEAWLVQLRSKMTPGQRKRLLDLVSDAIAPWFSKPEMLTDFLVDSFDSGGAESLTALSGVFYLIQHRNLDYPQFYTKVYSMIDQNILHSKQRSRFLRLMIIFLASTHLPAALVASFMKRLSRLCLHAPPSTIIAIVPWLYNMIKEHPVCAFMIHRRSPKEATQNDPLLGEDPFNHEETDPMYTNAIDSSLWEIHTLSSHFHPNVATIASIISTPFTKQSYKVEDFLDYTYDGMLESELSKNLKKPPVVEFQIPKRIFTKDTTEDQNELPLLRRMWDFSP